MNRSLKKSARWGVRASLSLLICAGAYAQAPSAADLEFFEKSVRPLLAEHCYKCHGPDEQESNLRLDHISTVLLGGERGPALVPGDPSKSRMVEAIRYGNVDLQMPADSKMPQEAIDTLTEWVRRGAPWPDEERPKAHSVAEAFDIEKLRDDHWAWQPVRQPEVPSVKQADWPSGDIDRFILSKLEENSLFPAEQADRRTLARRLYFDLTGLPPSPEALEIFLADTHPDAYGDLVDELLDSPAFGERWARHWMDLVRYAETYGHEGDYPILHAWRYRDYIIRALNDDVPYDQLVREHIAGDLLEQPRMHPTEGYNESVVGTGFWFMHQATHAPVDVEHDLAERIDNQIDVMTKAFLGMTVSCARCHDHKFDAISTKDYYSLTAFLRSSRQDFAYLDQNGEIAQAAKELSSKSARVENKYRRALRSLKIGASQIQDYLLAAGDVIGGTWADTDGALRPDIVFDDFETETFDRWAVEGEAFGEGSTALTEEESKKNEGAIGARYAGSKVKGNEGTGKLTSVPFEIERSHLKFRIGGGGDAERTYLRLTIDGETRKQASGKNSSVLHPVVWDLSEWVGQEGRIEIVDDHTGQWGEIRVDQIVFSDTPFSQPTHRPVERVAAERELDTGRLTDWVKALQEPEAQSANHPLKTWSEFAKDWRSSDEVLVAARDTRMTALLQDALFSSTESSPYVVFDDFNDGDLDGWFSSGFAFTPTATAPGDWNVLRNNFPLPGVMHSAMLSPKLQGTIRSETFTLTHDNIHFRYAGRGSKIKLIIERYALREYNGLLFGETLIDVNTGGNYRWQNMTNSLSKFKGRQAYIEVSDDGDGWVALDEIRFSDGKPPAESRAPSDAVLLGSLVDGESFFETLARRYQEIAEDSLVQWGHGNAVESGLELTRWMLQRNLINLDAPLKETQVQRAYIASLSDTILSPIRVIAMTEGTAEPAHVLVRGNAKMLGDPVERRFLEAIAGETPPTIESGSGRLLLAESILDDTNPLTNRVVANRLWHTIFGRGIVASVDNFGVLGTLPTHPDLLDYLAEEFKKGDYSIKEFLRTLLNTNTYKMSSVPSSQQAELNDPDNFLLHRMPVRRLQGEAIRDSLLAVAGNLDATMYGPSIQIYLSPFMGGHRRPAGSGPLNGDLRRTVYVEIRRNYLSPMMLAFDTPTPDTTTGRRTQSNVPAQALILLNDPFVTEQAKAWGTQMARTPGEPDDRVQEIYLRALGRLPTADELSLSLQFLLSQAEAYDMSDDSWEDDARVWSDFCHVMFTLKEFIYIG